MFSVFTCPFSGLILGSGICLKLSHIKKSAKLRKNLANQRANNSPKEHHQHINSLIGTIFLHLALFGMAHHSAGTGTENRS